MRRLTRERRSAADALRLAAAAVDEGSRATADHLRGGFDDLGALVHTGCTGTTGIDRQPPSSMAESTNPRPPNPGGTPPSPDPVRFNALTGLLEEAAQRPSSAKSNTASTLASGRSMAEASSTRMSTWSRPSSRRRARTILVSSRSMPTTWSAPNRPRMSSRPAPWPQPISSAVPPAVRPPSRRAPLRHAPPIR